MKKTTIRSLTLLLAVVAVVLGIEMYSLLLGEAASSSEQEVIRHAILGTDGVARVVQLRTMHLGPDEVLVVGGLELTYQSLGLPAPTRAAHELSVYTAEPATVHEERLKLLASWAAPLPREAEPRT